MSRRDHNQLKVFVLADELVPLVYEKTKGMPTEERYGLQSQIRRAAVSVPTNIVEGCTRPTNPDFVHFLVMAHGSTNEVRYLLHLSERLGITQKTSEIVARYDQLSQALSALIRSQS